MRKALFGAAASVVVLASVRADANGRFPASNQIVFSPTNPDLVVGRATYAILPSTDNGKTWGFLCEDVLALPSSASYQDPELGLTAGGALVAGLYAPTIGLDVSNDLGCNWNCIGGPLANQQIADIVVRPDAPPQSSHEVLALTNTFSVSSIGRASSQIFQSTDDGATWAALGGALDPAVAFTTLDVAKSDPMRIYLSGTRGVGTSAKASLFASADGGMTWTEQVIPQFNPSVQCNGDSSEQCPSEAAVFIAAVDPSDANHVYLRSKGIDASLTPGASTLYVTSDGGQSFQTVKRFTLPAPMPSNVIVGEMLGFALSPDGSKVFIGTKETGLWSASSADLSFTQVNPNIHVECLAERQTAAGSELWACADEASGFVFGKSTDDGLTFTAMMPTLTSMSGPVACKTAGSTSLACLASVNASACTCSSYEAACVSTEDITNACLGCSADAAAPPPPDPGAISSADSLSPHSACGCRVAGENGATRLFALGCGVALPLQWLRRSRKRRR